MIYNTEIKLLLEPKFANVPPKFNLMVDSVCVNQYTLTEQTEIIVNNNFSKGTHSLKIVFFNKTDNDLDTAILINQIFIENLSSISLSQGIYYPKFPEPWATQQREKGIDLFETYKFSTFLGWNGIWKFEFKTPIFEWIHEKENLGDLYPYTRDRQI